MVQQKARPYETTGDDAPLQPRSRRNSSPSTTKLPFNPHIVKIGKHCTNLESSATPFPYDSLANHSRIEVVGHGHNT